MAHKEVQAFTPQEVTTALTVVTNPAHFCEQPNVMRTAWQILKAARGQAVDLDHAGPAAHQMRRNTDMPARPSYMSPGCLQRLQAHAATKRVSITIGRTGGTAA